jgi:hypothetical protein
MSDPQTLSPMIDALIAASWREREDIKQQIIAWVQAQPELSRALDGLVEAKRGIDDLEVRWEVDEVLEHFAPPPEAPPEEPEAPPETPPPGAPPGAGDLEVVYDDPRGLALHRSKTDARWFATQRDPNTGVPQTFEVPAAQIDQLKTQLAGSPYWVIGAGA